MAIVVRNLRERETLRFPLVLLEGIVTWPSNPSDLLPAGCFVQARVAGDDSEACRWPVARSSGAFKAFVLLPRPGEFAIVLKVPELECEAVFHVEYAPIPAPEFVVRFYYQKSCDATEGFDAPPGVDNSDAAAIAKIQTAALLIQTATAEMMHEAGFGRRSFSMEFQPEGGKPLVRVLRTSFPNATAREIHDQKLIRLVEEDVVARGFDRDERRKFKHAVILGCSAYNPVTRKAEGHTALGGGKVGVFGSCGLHSWPSSIGEITSCCLNNARIDTTRLLDDSCYRGTFWANFSTGIGAFLHELGHTFGLGHSVSGIMARGFDDMNKLFSVYEISAASSANGYDRHYNDGFLELNYEAIAEVEQRSGAHWNLGSAALLKKFPWISGESIESAVGPTISWEDSARGPVGYGNYDGDQTPFNSPEIARGTACIGAVMIDAGNYVNNIQAYTRDEAAALAASGQCRSSGSTHWLVLSEHEYIERVDVRAMAWIDGLQIHTNLQSTRWYGGFGGKLHSLKAAAGYIVSEFFGSRGNHYVGKLGIRCHPTTVYHRSYSARPYLNTQSIVGQFPAAGLALERSQTPFGFLSNTVEHESVLVIRCNSYVESFRVEPQESEKRRNRSPSKDNQRHTDEQTFQLLSGEYLRALEVKSGHWVDALRFHTNFRQSPWYGGKGGDHHIVMECPPGNRLCGFFGSHGERYLGSIGAVYSALSDCSNDRVWAQNGSGAPGQNSTSELTTSFSLMRNLPSPTTTDFQQPHSLRGIVVAMEDGIVTSIESFVSIAEWMSRGKQPLGTNLYFVILEEQEAVVQIDISFRKSSEHAIIDGVCIHTTNRCSEWIGAFHNDKQVRFFVAPRGHSILRLSTIHNESGLPVDVAGFTAPICFTNTTEVDHIYRDFVKNLRLASWGHDVRVESAGDHPIESIVLSRRGGEDLDCHAWQWMAFFESKASVPECHRWCIPYRMLECYLSDKTRRMSPGSRHNAVKSELTVGAVDGGGAWNKASMADA